MKFSDLKSTILAQFLAPKGNTVVPFIEGKPGGGKSACAREIAQALQEKMKIKDEQIVEFNPSLCVIRSMCWGFRSSTCRAHTMSGFRLLSSITCAWEWDRPF